MPVDPATLKEVARVLGTKVFERRTQLGLTQEQLAARAGISRNQVQNIEHSRNNTKDPTTRLPGPGNPRLDTIYHLADALGLEPIVLIDPAAQLPR